MNGGGKIVLVKPSKEEASTRFVTGSDNDWLGVLPLITRLRKR